MINMINATCHSHISQTYFIYHTVITLLIFLNEGFKCQNGGGVGGHELDRIGVSRGMGDWRRKGGELGFSR